jgi:hypothetical protein
VRCTRLALRSVLLCGALQALVAHSAEPLHGAAMACGSVASSTPALEAQQKVELQAELRLALKWVGEKANADKGVALLARLSRQGLDEASYRLGSLYVTDGFARKSPAKALLCLARVDGMYKSSAQVLMGAIHAVGGKGVPKNLQLAKTIWAEVQTALDAEFETFGSPPQGVEDVQRRQLWYENSVALQAYSEHHGLRTHGDRK